MVDNVMNLFIDDSLNKDISLLGFCKIPFLNNKEIELLYNLSNDFFIDKETNNELYNSHNRNSPETNIKLSNQIKKITEEALERHFKNYRFFIGHFNLKKGGSDTFFNLHQDWCIVDESKFHSLQIWIPLDKSSPENGGMFFLPRSHKFYNNFRSGSFGVPVVEARGKLLKYIRPQILSAGEAVCFFNSTFHGTFENKSINDRSVVLMNIISAESPTSYFNLNKQTSQTDVYELTANKILTHLPQLEKGDVSNLKFIYTIALPNHLIGDVTERSLEYNTLNTNHFLKKLYNRSRKFFGL